MNYSVIGTFISIAKKFPTRVAIQMGEQRVTYGELRLKVEKYATALANLEGVVLIFLPQGIEGITLFLALLRSGAIPSFMPLPSTKQDLEIYWQSHRDLLQTLKPRAILTTSNHAEDMRGNGLDRLTEILTVSDLKPLANIEETTPVERSVILLQHSSGTTGLKKSVALGDRAVMLQISSYAKAIQATEKDIIVTWLPVYHDMGLIACTIMPLVLGQTIVLLDPFRWVSRPSLLFDEITDQKGTLIWLPNFAFAHLIRTTKSYPSRHNLDSVRAFINCSEPCRPATFDSFALHYASIGVRREMLQVCYAMAETVFAVTQTAIGTPPREITIALPPVSDKARYFDTGEPTMRVLSCGKPIDGASIVILSESGEEHKQDEIGEIAVVSKFAFDGYYLRDDLTRMKFQGKYYKTGDIGFFKDDELFVLGRTDDLIVVHGRNCFAHQIEAAANAVDGLRPGRIVAFGVYSEVTQSEEVVVVAEHESNLTGGRLDGVRRQVRTEVAQVIGVEVREVLLVPEGWLIKTTSGKISRTLNRKKYHKSWRE